MDNLDFRMVRTSTGLFADKAGSAGYSDVLTVRHSEIRIGGVLLPLGRYRGGCEETYERNVWQTSIIAHFIAKVLRWFGH